MWVPSGTAPTATSRRWPAAYPADPGNCTYDVPLPRWFAEQITLSAARLPIESPRPVLGFAPRPYDRFAFIEDERRQASGRGSFAGKTRFFALFPAEKDSRTATRLNRPCRRVSHALACSTSVVKPRSEFPDVKLKALANPGVFRGNRGKGYSRRAASNASGAR